ncbi:antirestriction protein ArdA [Campylobacter devanensis]|uniref:antirestriction protein ArdA n=1 Tax=Campylobacter devanensis TaxID=3161138 RepID=UPI000A356886|nr:antirestriction protein ArdA [Campylobacter sp. P0227]
MANKIDINKVFMGIKNSSLVFELTLCDHDSKDDLVEYLKDYLNVDEENLFSIEDEFKVYPKNSSLEYIWERYEILSEIDEEVIYQYDKNINSINTLSNDSLSDIKNYSFYKVSPKEYAQNLINDLRSWNGEQIPERLLSYLDYEEIANDLLISGDMVETGNGVLVLDYLNS